MNLKEKSRQLPELPGVYLMKDSCNDIIYVGKSKKLTNRVSSYFQNSKNRPSKVQKMVNNINDFEYIVTDTEFEAFLLECRLIKSIKPIYNKKMKCPQSYVYLKVNINEQYPDLLISQVFSDDGSLYFGPFISRSTVEQAVEGIKEICRIKCNNIRIKKDRRCLNYSMGLCIGMCQGDEKYKEYKKVITSILNLINGKDKEILKRLKLSMDESSEKLDYTQAAKYRDYIKAVNYIIHSQKIVDEAIRNRNIAAVEWLDDNSIKFFLISGNKIIYDEKIDISSQDTKEEISYMKDKILTYFRKNQSRKLKVVSKEEIDEAQIIYSYFRRNKNSNYKIVRESWLKDEKNDNLLNAIIDLCIKASKI